MSQEIAPVEKKALSTLPAPKKEDNKIALGHFPLPERTFEYDVTVSDKYQAFSAELLRLALLGIAAIGFLITNILLKSDSTTAKSSESISTEVKSCVIVSLICLGISAACSLLHRYFASDSIAYHLESLRLDIRQAKGDDNDASSERKGRRWRLKLSGILLLASGALLWLGAVFIITAFIKAI